MSPLLTDALADSRLLASRGWLRPTDAAVKEAARLLELVADHRAPSVQVEPDGTVVLAWEAAGHGWLTLAVNGQARLTHSAVIDGDEFEQAEEFGHALPGWAQELLGRLLRASH